MKKILFISALIALTNTVAAQAMIKEGLSEEYVNTAIQSVKYHDDFEQIIEDLGYHVKQISSSGNYHEHDWSEFQERLREKPLILNKGLKPWIYTSLSQGLLEVWIEAK